MLGWPPRRQFAELQGARGSHLLPHSDTHTRPRLHPIPSPLTMWPIPRKDLRAETEGIRTTSFHSELALLAFIMASTCSSEPSSMAGPLYPMPPLRPPLLVGSPAAALTARSRSDLLRKMGMC
eukprot:434464-Prorocentrum_minimum.AAC.1